MHDGTIHKYKLLKFMILDFVFGELENNRSDFDSLDLLKAYGRY